VLLYELGSYNSLKIPQFINFYEYEDFLEMDCSRRFVQITEELQVMSENVTTWHYNFTGTAGLFYMVHYATDAAKIEMERQDGLGVSMSWVWVAQHFNHRVNAILNRLVGWILILSMSTNSYDPGCLAQAP